MHPGQLVHGPVGDRFMWIIFWTRVTQSVMFIGVPVMVMSSRLAWVAHRRPRQSVAAQRRTLVTTIGLMAGVLAGLVCVWSNRALLAPALVAVCYLVAVVASELVHVAAPAGSSRTASLQARRLTTHLPRWAVALTCTAAAVTTSTPLVVTFLPAVRYGPWHPVTLDHNLTMPGQSQGWPSAYTTVPMAVIAAAALGAGAVIARRAALLPAVAFATGAGDPELARRAATRAAAGAVAGIELLLLAAMALSLSTTLAVPSEVGGLDYTLSRMLTWTALAAAAAGVVLWAAADTRPGQMVHPATP